MAKRTRPPARRRKAGRVIVVGSSNTDLVVHCARLPGAGETVLGGDMLEFAGGKGANQAVAAARAGAQTHFIGAFGDDAFGAARRRDLEADGIDCSGCVMKKKTPSGVALIAIGSAGKGRKKAKAENLIVVAPGANAKLTPADVKRGMPKDLDERDVVLCSLEVPFECVRTAFELGLKRGAETVLNPAPASNIKFLKKKVLPLATTITPNESECRELFGRMSGLPAHQKTLEGLMFPKTAFRYLVTTHGAKGAHLFVSADPDRPVIVGENLGNKKTRLALSSKEEPTALAKEVEKVLADAMKDPEIKKAFKSLKDNSSPEDWDISIQVTPAFQTLEIRAPKVKPIDTVGAGDCFNGALATYLALHPGSYDYESAVRFAVTAGAIAVTRHGAQAGMPKRAEILKLLKKSVR